MKLTKSMRESIAKQAIEKIFEVKFEDQKSKLADAILSLFQADGYQLGSDIPNGWEKYITVSSTVRVVGLYGIPRLNLKTTLCLKPYASLTIHSRDLVGSQELEELDTLIEEKEQIAQAIRAVLNSCNTCKQLVELSPELGEFLPSHEGSLLPVAVETLNKVKNSLTKDE